MSTRVSCISLGCSKNQVDAEVMLASLREEGFDIVMEPEQSDVVLINTCGFIESAKTEAIENILEMAELKKEGKIKGIVVSGCLAERYREQLLDELPEVDAVIGVGTMDRVCDAVRAAADGAHFGCFDAKEKGGLGGARLRTTPYYTAYLKIADGCDNCCAYCAIPKIRGRFRSRPMEELVEEARALAADGVTELTLIAQDTTRYGEDLYGEPRLAALLRELCKIEGLRWIRTLYGYVDRVTDELIDVIATEEKVVKYLDLPIQHGSDRMLKRMNRRDTRAGIIAMVKKLRERIPDIVLRTTLIVGFPGETKEDFNELCELVKLLKFDRLGVFTFSAEEGTPAALMTENVSERTKERRREIIMTEQAAISAMKNEQKLGRELTVLVEGFDRYGECWFGRSAADAPEVDGKVFFRAEGTLMAGQYVRVRIDEVMDYDLVGVRV